MDLEILIVTEVSQREKNKYHMISLTYEIQKFVQMTFMTKVK